jgi:hypothetical protein
MIENWKCRAEEAVFRSRNLWLSRLRILLGMRKREESFATLSLLSGSEALKRS